MVRILFLIVSAFLLPSCQTTPPAPPQPKNPWELTGKRPDRILVVQVALPENRRNSLLESWRDVGVSFPESAVGYLKPGSPNDLGAIFTGTGPSETASPVPVPQWQAYWTKVLKRSPFSRHLCLADETWSYAFQPNASYDSKSLSFRLVGDSPFQTLKASLQEDWPFIFFSLDGRRVDNQPRWEQELLATIAEAQLAKPLAVLILSFPTTTTLPPLKLRFDGLEGVKQSQRGILDTFTLKSSNLAQRARLASALKTSGKFEVVFSKQTTGERVHYIATYQKNAEPFSPAIIEASLGSTGPDAVGVRSLTALKNYNSLPLWLWSPHLKKSPVESAAHPTWLETPLFFDNQFGSGNPVRDVFSTFLGSF